MTKRTKLVLAQSFLCVMFAYWLFKNGVASNVFAASFIGLLIAAMFLKLRNQRTANEHEEISTADTEPMKPNYWRNPIPMSDELIQSIIDREAKPAVRLKRHWPPTEAPKSNSWLGGTPALPAELEWPRHPETGLHLHHLAQIDLSEMPQIDSEKPMPNEGVLWFFADIDDELLWEAGPGTSHSRVLYWPKSAAGIELTKEPETLPPIHHKAGLLEIEYWSPNGPVRNVFPKWPVTGHQTLSWEFSDSRPIDVTSPKVYSETLGIREVSEKQRICGDTIKSKYAQGTISRIEVESDVRPDGTTFDRKRNVYEPALWGGMFPYTVRLALGVLRQMHHATFSSHIQLTKTVSHIKNRGEVPLPSDLEKLDHIEALLESMKRLKSLLEESDINAPLLISHQTQFDALMNESFASNVMWDSGDSHTYNALVELTAEAIYNPDVLTGIPDQLLSVVEDTTLPSHCNSEHFLGGPKGCGTNPTAGEGIRLAQFGSDHAVRFMFCDAGIIDFWINEQDLKNSLWDRAWAATAGG